MQGMRGLAQGRCLAAGKMLDGWLHGHCGIAPNVTEPIAMKHTPPINWQPVQELAGEIMRAQVQGDAVLAASRTEELMQVLKDIEQRHGKRSRITATRADFTAEREQRVALYQAALKLATKEHDPEQQRQILQSLHDERNPE